MKRSRITYAIIATATIFALLQHRGAVAAPNPASPLWLIKGSYASLFSGTTIGGSSPLPFTGTGIFVSDGRGNLSGHETINFNGMVCSYKISGRYTLATDSSGTNAINFIGGGPGCDGGSYSQSLSVADGGNLVLLSNTSAGDIATEEWHRTRPLSP
jgi:hypothetical protein